MSDIFETEVHDLTFPEFVNSHEVAYLTGEQWLADSADLVRQAPEGAIKWTRVEDGEADADGDYVTVYAVGSVFTFTASRKIVVREAVS